MIRNVLAVSENVHFIRDATRGGVATVLHEIAGLANVGLELDEKSVPVNDEVRVLCELLGFDPLYIANEGKAVIVAAPGDADKIVHAMKRTRTGKEAAIIGFVTEAHPGIVVEKTRSGGKRILDVLTGDQLPRIC
jgi:hydrogenase expression/formation protein HypE